MINPILVYLYAEALRKIEEGDLAKRLINDPDGANSAWESFVEDIPESNEDLRSYLEEPCESEKTLAYEKTLVLFEGAMLKDRVLKQRLDQIDRILFESEAFSVDYSTGPVIRRAVYLIQQEVYTHLKGVVL